MNVTLMKAREKLIFPLYSILLVSIPNRCSSKNILINFCKYICLKVCFPGKQTATSTSSPTSSSKTQFPLPQQTALASAKLFCLLPCSSMNSVLCACFVSKFLFSLLGFLTPTIFKTIQDPLPNAFPKHCILQCLVFLFDSYYASIGISKSFLFFLNMLVIVLLRFNLLTEPVFLLKP